MGQPRTRQDPFFHPIIRMSGSMSSHLTAKPVTASSSRHPVHVPATAPPPFSKALNSDRVRPGHPAPPPRKSGVVSYPSMCCFHGFRDSGSQQSVVQRSVVVLCPSEMSRCTPYRVPTGSRREIDGVRPRTVVEVRGVTVRVCVCVRIPFRISRRKKCGFVDTMDGWMALHQTV